VASVVAIGVAATLVLFTQGIHRWIDTSATTYLDHTAAPLVVTERGVRDFLYSYGAVPSGTMARLTATAGVASAAPLLVLPGVLQGVRRPLPITVVGSLPGEPGGPVGPMTGRAVSGSGQAVVDQALARVNGLRVGSPLVVLGQPVRVVGIVGGGNAAGDFFVFVSLATARAMVGGSLTSDVLVTVRPGQDPVAVAGRIDRLPGVDAVPTRTLAAHDLAMIQSGVGEPVGIVVVVTLVIGLLIAAMVLYSATTEHAQDFAVLKALGSPARFVGLAIVTQAAVLAVGGFLVGWGAVSVLRLAIASVAPVIGVVLPPSLVATTFALFLAANVVAVTWPLWFVWHVDPQQVFKA
jgi:putative ABC transport system permease protein